MEISLKINSNVGNSCGSKFNRIERIFTQDRTMRTGIYPCHTERQTFAGAGNSMSLEQTFPVP